MSKVTVKGAGFKEMYNEYLSRGNSKLTLEEFKEIVYVSDKHIAEEMLKGRRVRLPYLGLLHVTKYQPSEDKLYFDYNHYKSTGEKRFITNLHSDGYIATFKWNKRFCSIKNQTLYNFKACRGLKRSLADMMRVPKGHVVYEETLKLK